MDEIEILYQDEHCLAVNKPSNKLVHHSFSSRNLNETESLMEYLTKKNITAFPIHRLDYKTSGIILMAKDKSFVHAFQQLFDQQAITKKYTALMRGFVEVGGHIDSPVKNENGQYKDALTYFELIRNYHLNFNIEPYPTARYSLVHLFPKTGRTHQLRIHANKIAHPIIGDPRYGNRHHNHFFSEQLGIPFLFLHAGELRFNHPFSNQSVIINAALPEFWKKFESIAHSHQLM